MPGFLKKIRVITISNHPMVLDRTNKALSLENDIEVVASELYSQKGANLTVED